MPQAARRGYHHGALRETLIDAARFLIAEKGPQGFTLIEAARLADVSPAAPYRHFRDRDSLVAAVAEQGFGFFAERLKGAFVTADDAAHGLEALGRAYLSFAREEPGYYGAMFLSVRPAGATDAIRNDDAFGLLLEAVRRLVPTTDPSFDPAPIAVQIWTMAHGVASLSATGRWPAALGAPTPEETLREGAMAILARRQQLPRGS
jgi:AcrR family transcriptional regulator